RETQDCDSDECLLQYAAIVDIARSARNEISEKQNKDRLRELRRLKRSEARQLEPAMGTRVHEENQNEQAEHDAHAREGPRRRIQLAIVQALEEHQDDE